MRSAARKGVTTLRASNTQIGFPRACRLLRRAEYDRVYSAGRRRSNSQFTVFFHPNELEVSRFGWSIKKTLGNAVTRNRIRRRLREILRLHRQEIAAGWDIVIHPRSTSARANFSGLMAELLKLLPLVDGAPKQS